MTDEPDWAADPPRMMHAERVWCVMREKARRDNEIIKEMLGRWVSEIEPTIGYRGSQVIGLVVGGVVMLEPNPAIVPIEKEMSDAFHRAFCQHLNTF